MTISPVISVKSSCQKSIIIKFQVYIGTAKKTILTVLEINPKNSLNERKVLLLISQTFRSFWINNFSRIIAKIIRQKIRIHQSKVKCC